jgi:hypothetical protein
MGVNSIRYSRGRLGNHIIRAFAATVLAKKNSLVFDYGEYFPKMKELGINLYTNGTTSYSSTIDVSTSELMNHIYKETANKSNIIIEDYYQSKDFSNYLYSYYRDPENQHSIIHANRFKERYNSNNDVFVHVRLDDVVCHNQGYDYYDKALSTLQFEHGYISSDTIDHDICKKLIQKYNLTPITYNEVETIMFGSTCKYIVLTGGTFSYIIGLFGFFSKVFYLKQISSWFPEELFFIDDWTQVSI